MINFLCQTTADPCRKLVTEVVAVPSKERERWDVRPQMSLLFRLNFVFIKIFNVRFKYKLFFVFYAILYILSAVDIMTYTHEENKRQWKTIKHRKQ